MLSKTRAHAPILLAMLALFFAIGGPTLASGAKKLISGKQIKSNAITTKHVKNGSLLKDDFQSGQLPAGANGANGAPGPAGPTASSRASKNFAPDVLLGPSSGTNVIDFDTTFAGASRLHMTFAGRIIANATVNYNWSSGSAQTIDCHIGRMNSTNTAEADAGQAEWQSLPVSGYATTSLTAAFEVPAGDYNIRVICSQIGGNANDTAVDDATLTAIAVAT